MVCLTVELANSFGCDDDAGAEASAAPPLGLWPETFLSIQVEKRQLRDVAMAEFRGQGQGQGQGQVPNSLKPKVNSMNRRRVNG
jgi:hypothetical protein